VFSDYWYKLESQLPTYIRFCYTYQNWYHMPVHVRVWLLSFILVTQTEVFRIIIKIHLHSIHHSWYNDAEHVTEQI